MQTAIITNERVTPSIAAYLAVPEQAAEATELLVRTAEWLKSKGSTQWSGLLNGEDMHDMAGAVRKGDVYLFRDGETLAGVVMLVRLPSEWDRKLWGEDGHEGAVYLHRLAINRDYGGSGLGRDIMRWAESGIAFPGANRIRLDCIGDNKALNAFYSEAGYRKIGMAPNGFSLYEKTIR